VKVSNRCESRVAPWNDALLLTVAGELGGVLFACHEAGGWGLGLMHSYSLFLLLPA